MKPFLAAVAAVMLGAVAWAGVRAYVPITPHPLADWIPCGRIYSEETQSHVSLFVMRQECCLGPQTGSDFVVGERCQMLIAAESVTP